MAGTDHKIAITAHITAYAWYQAGLPYAEHFATSKGAPLYWTVRAAEFGGSFLKTRPSLTGWLEARHRLIERGLGHYVPDRIIEVASGLTRRGVTWAIDYEIDYVEMDLPHMVAAKADMISRMPAELRQKLEGRHRVVPIDALADDFPDRLAEAARGASRVAVITEGLLSYFDLKGKRRIMRGIAQGLADTGGRYFTDLRTEELIAPIASSHRLLQLSTSLITGGRGQREDFADDASIERAFEQAGFVDPDQATRLPKYKRLKDNLPGNIWWGDVPVPAE